MEATKPNAVIMAAGTSSRFVPLSSERPKGLLEVKGEVLIERQIRQLREAGITDITVVVGYKAGMFAYLAEKYGVNLVLNEDYDRYNNTSSLIRVLDRLGDTFICSSDNYFPDNVFMQQPETSCYSALYADGPTGEYCLQTDADDRISGVTVGGADSWYMVGHVYFTREFSEAFSRILKRDYSDDEATRMGYWEDTYIRHLDELPPMKIHRYAPDDIEEFDSLDELREFDSSYRKDTRSEVIARLARRMNCGQEDLTGFKRIKCGDESLRFSFVKGGLRYIYDSSTDSISKE